MCGGHHGLVPSARALLMGAYFVNAHGRWPLVAWQVLHGSLTGPATRGRFVPGRLNALCFKS